MKDRNNAQDWKPNLTGLYSVFDEASGAFIRPFTSPNHATAIRGCVSSAIGPTSDMKDFGSQYTLFCIGTWEEEKGECVMHEVKESLGTVLELLAAFEKKRALV